MAELADAQDLGSCVLGRESSSLSTRTGSWAGAQTMPHGARWHRFNRPAPQLPEPKTDSASDDACLSPPDLTITILRLDTGGRVYFPRPATMCQPRWSALGPGCARLTWSFEASRAQSTYDSRGRHHLRVRRAARRHQLTVEHRLPFRTAGP